MSNQSSVLISFGAAVDEESFKKVIANLKKNLAAAANALASGNSGKKDSIVARAMKDLEDLEKAAKKSIPDVAKLLSEVMSPKAMSKEGMTAVIAEMAVMRAGAAATAASVDKMNASIVKGKGKASLEGKEDLSPYMSMKKGLDDLYEKDMARSRFLRMAYKETIGKLDPSQENIAQLRLAAKEFEKYSKADYSFRKSTGKEDWDKNTSFNRVFGAINEKIVRFDKDLGFFTTNIADGAKALGVSQDVIRKTQLKNVEGLKAIEQVLQYDKKSGGTSGYQAKQMLHSIYGSGAKGADVFGPQLLQTTKFMNSSAYAKSGIGGDAASLTNAALQDNISLTTRSIKIHNEEGLKAAKITEEFAIKQGLLSNRFQGSGYDLQKLNQQYNRFTTEQKAAFSATGASQTDVESFKKGMAAVRAASKEAVSVGVAQDFDLATAAVTKFNGEVKKSQNETEKLATKLKGGGTAKVASAVDFGPIKKDDPRYDAYVKEINKVEQAIKAKSIAMGEDANASKSFYQTADRGKMALASLSGQIKVTGTDITVTKIKMTEAERMMHKYRNETDQFKGALAELIKMYGTSGQPIGRYLAGLKEASKVMDDTKKKIDQMGGDSGKWAKNFNMTEIARSGLGQGAGLAFIKEVDEVGKAFDRVHGKGGIFKRGLTDLFEKFKILAGYAISGGIVYGIGNMFKNAIAGVMQYDQSLKDLQAITQSTNQQTAKMGEEIFRVATTTKFSVLELADGMKMLGQSGYSAGEAIAALEPIARLATATLSDFATINDLVTTTLGAFDMDDTQVEKVTDIFGAAINKSKLNVEKLRVAMNYVGPIAHDAGMSLEEVAAAMGLFANSGLRASTIGTAFRQIIAKLMSPTDDFKDAVLGAGYTMEEMNPRVTKFSEIIEKLVHVVPDAENAFKFFGQRASSAMSVLTRAGTSGFEEMTESMRENGLVTKMAEKQMEGLSVMAKNLSDTIGVASIKIGQAFGIDTVIRGTISASKSLLSSILETTEGFGGMIASIIKTGVVLTGLVFIVNAYKSSAAVLAAAGASQSLVFNMASASITGFGAALKTTTTLFFGLSLPMWGMIAAFSALAVVVGTVITAWKPWESELDKRARKLEEEKKIVESNIKAHDSLYESSVSLVKVVKDSKAPLNDRIQAYVSLRRAGGDLDDSINSNITSVGDFDAALKKSEGKINSYINKLEEMGEGFKKAAGRVFGNEKRMLEESIREGQKKLMMADKAYVNDMGVESLYYTDAELKEISDKLEDDKAALEEQRRTVVGHFGRELENNITLREKLTKAQADFDQVGIQEAYDDLVKMVSDQTGFSVRDIEAHGKSYFENLKKLEAQMNASEAILYESLKGTNKIDENKAKRGDVAVSNIVSIGNQLKDRIAGEDKFLEDLANAVGTESPEYKEQADRLRRAREKRTEDATKMIDEQFKVVDTGLQAKINNFKEQKETELSAMKAAVATGKMTEDVFLTKQDNIKVEIAQNEYDETMRAFEVIKATGVVSAEMIETMKNSELKLARAIQDAQTERLKGSKSLSEKRSRENEKDLRESLKNIHDIYKVEKEKLDERENAELAKNREVNQFNQTAAEQEEFEIKKRFGELKLKLVQELIAKEQAIRDAGGSLTADKTGQLELSKLEQEKANLLAEERMNAAALARENLETERNLNWEYKQLQLQDERDYYEQKMGEEQIRYEQESEALKQRLLDGKMTWENYLRERTNQQLKHSQNVATIERQTNELRISNQAQLVGELAGIMGELYSISGEKAKAFFYAQKALTVTEMVMNAYKTWSAAMATPNVSPIFNIPMATMMLGMGLAKAGLVAGLTVAQGVKGFAEGGEIGGYSPSPTADNIPIWATAGEFMQPVSAVQYYGKGAMEALRTKSIPREVFSAVSSRGHKSGGSGYAEGGAVEGTPGEKNNDTSQNLHIVNVLDPGMFDQYMSSHAGQKTLMNIISKNPQVIKNIVRN